MNQPLNNHATYAFWLTSRVRFTSLRAICNKRQNPNFFSTGVFPGKPEKKISRGEGARGPDGSSLARMFACSMAGFLLIENSSFVAFCSEHHQVLITITTLFKCDSVNELSTRALIADSNEINSNCQIISNCQDTSVGSLRQKLLNSNMSSETFVRPFREHFIPRNMQYLYAHAFPAPRWSSIRTNHRKASFDFRLGHSGFSEYAQVIIDK